MSVVHAAYPTQSREVDNSFETWWSPTSKGEQTTAKNFCPTPALPQYTNPDIWSQPQIIPTLTSMDFPQQQWSGPIMSFTAPEFHSVSPETPSHSMRARSYSTEAYLHVEESSVLCEDARRTRRRAQNREAQRAYRARKEKASDEYVMEMRKTQQEIKILRDLNRQLKYELYLLKKQVAKAAMW